MAKNKFGTGDQLVAILLIFIILFKFLPSTVAFSIFGALISFWIWIVFNKRQHLQRRGIPIPPTNNFLFGHNFAMVNPIEFNSHNFSNYGKTFGACFMDRNELRTMDVSIARQICLEHFGNFRNNFKNFVETQNEEVMSRSIMRNRISALHDENWRRVRRRVTPAFTTSKLKKLIPSLCQSANQMCEFVATQFVECKKEIPLKEIFSRLILEDFGRSVFSMDFDSFGNDRQANVFLQNAHNIFEIRRNARLLTIITFCPFIVDCLERYFHVDLLQNNSHHFFQNLMADIYERRKDQPEAKMIYNDIFQLLMNSVEEGGNEEEMKGDAKIEDGQNDGQVEEDTELVDWQILKGPLKNNHLTPIELFSQAMMFLITGYETTVLVLHYAIYLLALHPEVQNKLRQEIEQMLGDDKESSNNVEYEYGQLKKLEYLQATLQETERLFPPGHVLNRQCSADIELDGVPFHAGDLVTMSVYHIQRSAEHYPEPEKFIPERFLPENRSELDPTTFLAFGLGPRNCLGMRFAQLQMHIALAKLIRQFRFLPGPNTPKLPLKFESAHQLIPVEKLVVIGEKIVI